MFTGAVESIGGDVDSLSRQVPAMFMSAFVFEIQIARASSPAWLERRLIASSSW
jgi:hypothetical protein